MNTWLKNVIPLEEGKFYHIFNRGNNSINLFYRPENYHYFLKKYDEYLSNFVDTYCYCLLPNHFHLLIKIKNEVASIEVGKQTYEGAERVVSERFRRFFMAYAKAINKQENRHGSLFQKTFKRKLIDSDNYFSTLIYYIHANPELHGLTNNFRTYNHSSYQRILIDKPSKLKKSIVLDWFGSKDEYKRFHYSSRNLSGIRNLLIE